MAFHRVSDPKMLSRLRLGFLAVSLAITAAAAGLTYWNIVSNSPLATGLSGTAIVAAAWLWIHQWNFRKVLKEREPRANADPQNPRIKKMLATGYWRMRLGPSVVMIEPEGLSAEGEYSRTDYGWHAFDRVEEGPDHLFLRLVDETQGLVLPKRALSGVPAANVIEAINGHIERANRESVAA